MIRFSTPSNKILSSAVAIMTISCGAQITKKGGGSWSGNSDQIPTTTDCRNEVFARGNDSAGILTPAETLTLNTKSDAKITLCNILIDNDADFLVIHFVNSLETSASDLTVKVDEFLKTKHANGYQALVASPIFAAPDGLERTEFFKDPSDSLRNYFSSGDFGLAAENRIAIVNFDKEAVAYSYTTLDLGTLETHAESLLESLSGNDSRDSGTTPEEEEDFDPIEKGLGLFKLSELQTGLQHITKDEFKGRMSATPGNEAVANYIVDKLKGWGVGSAKPEGYLQSFKMKNGPTSGKTTSNIVALIPGTDPALKDQYVVIGAHMDHAGTLDLGYTCSSGGGGDRICNGADDNGSGTISLLNIAESLSHVKTKLKRSVILMWYSGEEEGLEGSYYYVNSNPIIPTSKIVYMINMDMVGYLDSNNATLNALGGGTSSVGKGILEAINPSYPGIKIKVSSSAGGGSDHVPFMSKGIPGVFFHTGVSNNPNYHRTSDSPDKIDYDGMLIAAKVAFETLVRVANEPTLTNFSFVQDGVERPSLVTEEEMKQSCHDLRHIH